MSDGADNFKNFLHQTKEQGQSYIDREFAGGEATTLIKDLLQIVQSLQTQAAASSAGSADSSLFKRKYEHLRQENNQTEKTLRQIKEKAIPLVVAELKEIISNAQNIAKSSTEEAASNAHVDSIKASAKKIIEAFL